MTRFAISVPVGAWHPLLPDTLKSLLVQDVDISIALLDASGDARVRELAGAHRDRLAYVHHGPDEGQSAAILEGWANTGGDILGWLNADDALAPGALAAVAQAFESDPNLDVFYGNSIICDEVGDITGIHWSVEPPSEMILRGCIISQPSCFFRRRAHDAVGGLDTDLQYTMDWDLWIRLWRAGHRFGFTEAVLSRVLWGRDTKTGQFNRVRRAELERLIGQNQRFIDRVNSRVGYAIQFLLEQPVLKRLSPLVHRLLAGERAPVSGLGAHGEIRGTAHIPLFAYSEAPVGRILVEFREGFDGAVTLRTRAGELEKPAGETCAMISLEPPLQQGEIIDLELLARLEEGGEDAPRMAQIRFQR